MTGIEILASNEVATKYNFNWTLCWIIGCIVLGIFISIGIASYIKYYDINETIMFFVAGVFLGTLMGGITGMACGEPVEYTTEYKVTISDEVLMTEFNERYKIIDQDGKIYTIRERE